MLRIDCHYTIGLHVLSSYSAYASFVYAIIILMPMQCDWLIASTGSNARSDSPFSGVYGVSDSGGPDLADLIYFAVPRTVEVVKDHARYIALFLWLLRPVLQVVLLQNMCGGPSEVDDDLEPETAEECAKYGAVVTCMIYQMPDAGEGPEVVRIFVEFEAVEAAARGKRYLPVYLSSEFPVLHLYICKGRFGRSTPCFVKVNPCLTVCLPVKRSHSEAIRWLHVGCRFPSWGSNPPPMWCPRLHEAIVLPAHRGADELCTDRGLNACLSALEPGTPS